VKAVLFATV